RILLNDFLKSPNEVRFAEEASAASGGSLMKPRGVLALLLGTAFCAWGVPAFAQSQAINGTIEGTTKDVQGGVLPGVTVTITHLDTGTQRVVVTNETGTFRAPLLPLGH